MNIKLLQKNFVQNAKSLAAISLAAKVALLQAERQEINNAQRFELNLQQKVDAQEDACHVSKSTKCGQTHGSCPVAGTYCSTYGWCGYSSAYQNSSNSAYNYKAECAKPKASQSSSLNYDDIKKLAKKLGIKIPKLENIIKIIAKKLHIKISDRKITSVLNDVEKKLMPILEKIPEEKLIGLVKKLEKKLNIKIPTRAIEDFVSKIARKIPSVAEGAVDVVSKIIPKSTFLDGVGDFLGDVLGDAAAVGEDAVIIA